MKSLKRMISILLCFILGITPFLTACDDGTNASKEEVTVSFYEDSLAEAPFTTLKVEKGTVPDYDSVALPERTGEEFVGWTETQNSQSVYDTTLPVEADLSLYGIWRTARKETLTKITFDANYPGGSPKSASGKSGAAIEFPTMERDLYTFLGWYLDPEGNERFTDLNYPDRDLTVYAKWEVNTDSAYTVTYMVGEEVYATLAAAKGGKATDLDCTHSSYVFVKWLSENGEPYDFNAAVDKNLTLFAEYYSKGLDVEDLGDGTGEVWDYDTQYGRKVVVPAEWKDDATGETLRIVAIASLQALEVDSIVIKEGVERIDANAFANCESLQEVVIPASVTSIGSGAFAGCPNLTHVGVQENDSITVEDGILVADGNKAIYYVGDPTDGTVTIPEGITSIERNAFSYAQIGKLVVPSTVTSVAQNAFSNCLIREVDYRPSVDNVPRQAFANSARLTSVTFAQNVTKFDQQAFNHCTSLSSVTIEANEITLANNAFYYCQSLTSFPFEKVTESGENCFSFAGIQSYTFPAGTTEIKANEFDNWNSLQRIELLPGITTIGDSAFDGCESLTEVVIPDDSELTYIGERAFAGTKITEVDLTKCVRLKKIGNEAYSGCSLVTSVKLPANLHAIGFGAFSGCVTLETYESPFAGAYDYQGFCDQYNDDYMHYFVATRLYAFEAQYHGNISKTAEDYFNEYKANNDKFFSDYNSYLSQYIPDAIKYYPYRNGDKEEEYMKLALTECFSSLSLFGYIFGSTSYEDSVLIQQYMTISSGGTPLTTSYYIPGHLNKITINGKYVNAFAFNSMLSWEGDYVFTDKLEAIGAYAFSVNSAQTSYDFAPATSLKSIGQSAFSSNRSLEEVVFPASLRSIGESAFRYCSGLVSVKIPSASADDPLFLERNAFADCEKLAIFYAEGDTPEQGVYKFQNLVLSNYTFYGCDMLRKIESPNSVGFNIGYSAAVGSALICNPAVTESLEEVVFPDNVSKYTYYLPEGVTDEAAAQHGFVSGMLPGNLFYGCPNLKAFNAGNQIDVNIPEGITAIGASAFQAETRGEQSKIMPIYTIHFPESVKRLYSGAFGHTGLTNVDAGMIDDIADGFDYADKIVRLVIPENTKLSANALRCTKSLKTLALKKADGTLQEEENTVYLPNGATEIPNYAFQYCGVEHIGITEGVKSIGTYAFYGAEGLEAIAFPDSLESLGNGAFERCFNLKTVKFSSAGNLRTLGGAVFEYCTSLQEIEIPEGVVSMGNDLFLGDINLERVTLPASVFYAIGAGAFANCLKLKEIFLFGSVPPQIDFETGGDTLTSQYLSTAFYLVDQTDLASIPSDVAAELRKVSENFTQNVRSMAGNMEDFNGYYVGINHLKIYVPEDSVSLYEAHVANNVRILYGSIQGEAQKSNLGWHMYESAFAPYESGVFVEENSSVPTAFYRTDSKAWFKVGDGDLTEATEEGGAYSVNGASYTYNAETNVLSKNGAAMKSFGGVYLGAEQFPTTAVGGGDLSVDKDLYEGRSIQFRPMLNLAADGAVTMVVYEAEPGAAKGSTRTVFTPHLYYGTYTLSWENGGLKVDLSFTERTVFTFASNDLGVAFETSTLAFSLTEGQSGFTGRLETGTPLGDLPIVFTRGTTIAE